MFFWFAAKCERNISAYKCWCITCKVFMLSHYSVITYCWLIASTRSVILVNQSFVVFCCCFFFSFAAECKPIFQLHSAGVSLTKCSTQSFTGSFWCDNVLLAHCWHNTSFSSQPVLRDIWLTCKANVSLCSRPVVICSSSVVNFSVGRFSETVQTLGFKHGTMILSGNTFLNIPIWVTSLRGQGHRRSGTRSIIAIFWPIFFFKYCSQVQTQTWFKDTCWFDLSMHTKLVDPLERSQVARDQDIRKK